jgi:hypothetical protein
MTSLRCRGKVRSSRRVEFLVLETIHQHRDRARQSSKDAALADSVSLRRLDFVELLVENGAEITSVPGADVLATWEPKLIRFFLDHRADPILIAQSR